MSMIIRLAVRFPFRDCRVYCGALVVSCTEEPHTRVGVVADDFRTSRGQELCKSMDLSHR